ncbi:MAG: TrmH family RNA methyltransferase, partial [Chitinophagaceae bacterium]
SIHQFTDVDRCFTDLRKRFDKIYATHLAADSVELHSLNLTESLALVFGNERTGVSEEVIHLCDGNFIIPQVGIIKSLNISVACAVSLYEAYRQKKLAGHYEFPKMDGDERTRLREEWGFSEEE